MYVYSYKFSHDTTFSLNVFFVKNYKNNFLHTLQGYIQILSYNLISAIRLLVHTYHASII